MRRILTILPVFTALVFAGSASANNYGSSGLNSASSNSLNYANPGLSVAHGFREDNIGNASSTASRLYRVGVRAYEKNKLEEAERAFKRALLANGLDAEILVYLTKIAETNGEMEKAVSYALAYNELHQR